MLGPQQQKMRMVQDDKKFSDPVVREKYESFKRRSTVATTSSASKSPTKSRPSMIKKSSKRNGRKQPTFTVRKEGQLERKKN